VLKDMPPQFGKMYSEVGGQRSRRSGCYCTNSPHSSRRCLQTRKSLRVARRGFHKCASIIHRRMVSLPISRLCLAFRYSLASVGPKSA
jgi:hypothetical protein